MPCLAKHSQEDYGGAIVDYNEALRLNPNYAKAYHNRGIAYQELGENRSALADFRQAERLYQQQGNTRYSQDLQRRIRELGLRL